MDHKNETTLRELLAASPVLIGETYVHYKDREKVYVVTDVVIAEADNTVSIVYKALSGDTEGISFVRPLREFQEWISFPEGNSIQRFSLVTVK